MKKQDHIKVSKGMPREQPRHSTHLTSSSPWWGIAFAVIHLVGECDPLTHRWMKALQISLMTLDDSDLTHVHVELHPRHQRIQRRMNFVRCSYFESRSPLTAKAGFGLDLLRSSAWASTALRSGCVLLLWIWDEFPDAPIHRITRNILS